MGNCQHGYDRLTGYVASLSQLLCDAPIGKSGPSFRPAVALAAPIALLLVLPLSLPIRMIA